LTLRVADETPRGSSEPVTPRLVRLSMADVLTLEAVSNEHCEQNSRAVDGVRVKLPAS
jgi:hypothetical protein